MNYKFDNMTTETFNENEKNNFLEFDYENTLVKKEFFTVELNNKKVKLHTYIKDIDMSEYDNSNEHIIELGVMPDFKSLSKNKKEDILSQFTDDDKEYYKKNTNELLMDVLMQGYFITLHTETTTNENEVENLINSAIAVHHCVEGLIGFDLDKYQNRIGNTGWDYLEDFCNGKDLIKLAMKRFKK